MGEPIFSIDMVKKSVLELLRKDGEAMPAGLIAVRLEMPFYAVQAGLDAALTAGEVDFWAGTWHAREREPSRLVLELDQEGLL